MHRLCLFDSEQRRSCSQDKYRCRICLHVFQIVNVGSVAFGFSPPRDREEAGAARSPKWVRQGLLLLEPFHFFLHFLVAISFPFALQRSFDSEVVILFFSTSGILSCFWRWTDLGIEMWLDSDENLSDSYSARTKYIQPILTHPSCLRLATWDQS